MPGKSQHPLIHSSQQGLCDDEVLCREIPGTSNLLGISATTSCDMIWAASLVRAQFPNRCGDLARNESYRGTSQHMIACAEGAIMAAKLRA
jgi:hypothetical protein